jgi:hypothetical protein
MGKETNTSVVIALLSEIETLEAWLDDTGYPRASRRDLESAIADVKRRFGLERGETPA